MIQKNKELSRYPQSLNYNPNALESIFGEEADIIRDIAILGSINYQKTLFDTTRLTIVDFEKLGYSKYNLQRVLPEFSHLSRQDIKRIVAERVKQLEQARIGDISITSDENTEYPFLHDHLCITRLDYAFYKASKISLNLSQKIQDRVTNKRINVLKDDVSISNVSQKDKRVYEYQLSTSWIEALYKAYHLIDFKDYLSLSVDGKSDRIGVLKSFYLYLGRIISMAKYQYEQGNNPIYITTIDEICKVADCSNTEPKDKKKFVTSLLNDVLKRVEKSKFSWEYFSPTNQRAKYHIKFTFSEETLNSFDEGKAAVYSKLLYEESLNFYKAKIFKKDIRKIGNFEESEFIEWFSSNVDLEEKKKLQEEVYNKVYRKIDFGNNKTKPLKRYYIPVETIRQAAEIANQSIEDFAKKNKYIKDEKGEYYKLQ